MHTPRSNPRFDFYFRLNTTGLYVVCNKAQFQIEVTNNDPNMVMCGIRVLVGTQDAQKAPSYVEVVKRTNLKIN